MKKFVRPRLALMLSAAVLVVAACSTEGPAPEVAGPSLTPRAGISLASLNGTPTAGYVQVCIANTSPAGLSYVVNVAAASTNTGDNVANSVNLSAGGCAIALARTVEASPSPVTTVTLTLDNAGTASFICGYAAGDPTFCGAGPGNSAVLSGSGPVAVASASAYHGATVTFHLVPPTVGTGVCVAPAPAFGLGAAGQFTLLGLSGATFNIGSGETRIFGNVGIGPVNTGTLKKATIDGDLTVDGSATATIVSDLNVLGSTFSASLATASSNANTASGVLAGMLPVDFTYGNLTGSQSFVRNDAITVISISSVNMIKKTITITGGTTDVFVFNVANGFNFRSSQMILAGGVVPSNIIWNFPGNTGEVVVKDPATNASGIFLAPSRNFNGDKATITGGVLGGKILLIHSGTQLSCQPT